jgi:hypothetical protein
VQGGSKAVHRVDKCSIMIIASEGKAVDFRYDRAEYSMPDKDGCQTVPQHGGESDSARIYWFKL